MKKSVVSVILGALISFAATLVLVAAFALAVKYVDISASAMSVIFVAIKLASIVLGACFACKRTGKRGALTGLFVALIYFVLMHALGLFFARTADFTLVAADALVTLASGAVAGIISINIFT